MYVYIYTYGVGGLRKGYQATALVTYLSGFVLFGCKLDAHMLDVFLSSWFSCWWKGLRHQKLFLFTLHEWLWRRNKNVNEKFTPAQMCKEMGKLCQWRA